MTPALPPLDMHAHVATSTTPRQLERLGAVVFAATRSLDEYERVATRKDLVTVWGVGSHPGVPAAIDNFDAERFRRFVERTPFVSEIGLERRSKVDLGSQQAVFTSILDILEGTPRIVSLHSSGAIDAVLDAIKAHPAPGLVLHWWRGNAAQTRRAVELGCWFSVNAAGLKYPADVALIPLDRLLTETDHPTGDRSSPTPSLRIAILTCMDARIRVFEIFGLLQGESHVLRNAGGIVTDDAIRSLALSQRKLGTREILIMQHTDCGLNAVTEDSFKDELEDHMQRAQASAAS